MTKILKFIPLVTLLIISGCTSSIVIKPGSSINSEYAPINESSRPGTVKYLNQGLKPIVEARRSNAYKTMHEACGGKYKILNEGQRSEDGVAVPTGYGAVYSESQYIYINFQCVTE